MQIAEHKFKSEIIREYSITPVVENLGMADNTMTLYISDNNKNKGAIEWYIEYEDGTDDVVDIGLWFEGGKELCDYDGVFSLPKEAIIFLEAQGFNCEYAK
jgi:hypothetical protein